MLKQNLNLKLQQKLSPQQIQLMKLLQLPTVAFEQRLKEELEENPALEEGKEETEKEEDFADNTEEFENSDSGEEDFDISEYMDESDIPEYRLQANNKSKDDEDKKIPFAGGTTFHEHLEKQLQVQSIDEKQKEIAFHLIGSLDDAGYLRREISSIVDDLAFTQNITATEQKVLEALRIIQTLDPPGVGCRDLQECLLIQLNRKKSKSLVGLFELDIAKQIIQDCFDEFTKKHYDKILKRLDVEEEELRDALEIILKLNPKPGNSLSETTKTVQHVIPDFTITVDDDELNLTLNGRNAPELRMSKDYLEMLEAYTKDKTKSNQEKKDAVVFVKQKLDSAKWFIDAIRQRQNTLLVTMNAIMNYQKEYFLEGDETKLKPMILKDIADQVGLDISTISRVVNSKWVQTPFGTFLLKTFFSESLTNDAGEEVSTREVKKILQDAIDAENKKKPLTDEKLMNLLKEKGYNIARRTVAKYREQLDIPVARLRKEI